MRTASCRILERLPIHDVDIIQWTEDPDRNILAGEESATQVILVDDLVVKFGDVYEEEASNQEHAYQLLDGSMIKVPRVYHYFRAADIGYLVMEYVPATPVSATDAEHISSIAKCINYLHNFSAVRPGPLRGTVSRSRLWPETENTSINTSEAMEAYVNSRLVSPSEPFKLAEPAFQLCHLDLAPRNILHTQDGCYCLIDWASAGWYPRAFEIAVLRSNHGFGDRDVEFCDRLETAITDLHPLSQAEHQHVEMMVEVAFNQDKYCL